MTTTTVTTTAMTTTMTMERINDVGKKAVYEDKATGRHSAMVREKKRQ